MSDDELKAAVPRWRDAELKTDLWPRMLLRLEKAPPAFGWFEWALAGAIAVTFALFPELLPAMLYQL